MCKAAGTLNHALIDEFLERLLAFYNLNILEELVPEAAVNEVACGVLAATQIEVHIIPIPVSLWAYQRLAVVRIGVAGIVC